MNSNNARQWQQYSAQTQRDNQRKVVVKVRSKNWLTKGEKVIYAFLATALLGIGIFIVSYASSVDTLNRDVQSLEQDIQQQTAKNDELLGEVRELSKSERITSIAKENGLKIQDAKVKRAVE